MNGEPLSDVLTVGDIGLAAISPLAEKFGLQLVEVVPDQPLPGSFWGNPEAGIVGRTVYVSSETPVHSFLHEACHIICMTPALRDSHAGNAGSDDLEEAAVCYLQLALADQVPGVGRSRLMADMDAWGYSFRLGSTERWYSDDADDARAWLQRYSLIDGSGQPTFRLREAA